MLNEQLKKEQTEKARLSLQLEEERTANKKL